jgi:hypothetical protein
MQKTIKELQAGDVFKAISGNDVKVLFIHPTVFDPSIFSLTGFDLTLQEEVFEYELANTSVEIVKVGA